MRDFKLWIILVVIIVAIVGYNQQYGNPFAPKAKENNMSKLTEAELRDILSKNSWKIGGLSMSDETRIKLDPYGSSRKEIQDNLDKLTEAYGPRLQGWGFTVQSYEDAIKTREDQVDKLKAEIALLSKKAASDKGVQSEKVLPDTYEYRDGRWLQQRPKPLPVPE